MSVKVKYKDSEIINLTETGNKTVKTKGKYCEDDFVIENTKDGGVEPTGTINITENGLYDVAEYANANVDVAGGGDLPTLFEGVNQSPGSFPNYFQSSTLQLYIKNFPQAFVEQFCVAHRNSANGYNGQYLFSGLGYYEGTLNLTNYSGNLPSDMSYMFQGLGFGSTGAEEVIFPTNFGANAMNMGYMFNSAKIKKLDLTKFNTAKCTSMNYMFQNLTLIKKLDFSSFDTSKCTNMSNFLYNCTDLEEVVLPQGFGSAATSISYFFAGCTNLKEIDLPIGFGSKATSGTYLFNGCRNLTNLKINDNTFGSQMTTMSNMFAYTLNSPLETLDLSNLNTAKCTTMQSMFQTSTSIKIKTKKIIFPTNFGNLVNNVSSMFRYVSNTEDTEITELNLTGIVFPKVTNVQYMFGTCMFLKKITMPDFAPTNLTTTSQMFNGCYRITELDISGWDLTKATTATGMFTNFGLYATAADGAYADGISYIYVKNEACQNWILTKTNGRPTTWTTANVIVAGSPQDLRGI